MIKSIFTTLIGLSFLLIVGTIGYGIAFFLKDYQYNERNLIITLVTSFVLIISNYIGKLFLGLKHEKVKTNVSHNNNHVDISI